MIIDNDGVDGFNIRKLGAALGVNGASLYHHYESKNAIFEDAARMLLSNVESPNAFEPGDFIASAIRSSHGYLDALLEHPKAIPLVLLNLPSIGRPEATSHLITGFTRLGVSPQDAVWGIETLEALVIGTALVQSSRAYAEIQAKTKAVAADERQFFDSTLRSILDTIVSRGKPAKKRSR
jgi:TetR/AcrR family tetracycline transcriptional repressor